MQAFLEKLNPVQREAATIIDGPVMIVAGAGSGKTRVLTFRTAYIIAQGKRPESILALTFTNKAAQEMRARITELVGPESKSIWMGTFHSLFARILRFEAEHLGYERNFSIYDSDDSLQMIKSIMNSLNISMQQFPPQGIRSRISSAKNQMISAKALKSSALDPLIERTAAVFEEYERRLKLNNAMDFDDLLLKPLELFQKHKEILERYQWRFRYIMVDEYQDTNRVQYKLIKEIAALGRNICVVGDDAQSIYAFRGADIRNILDFERDYPDARVFRLEQNYRSTKMILAAADSVIKNNVDQIRKTLWTENTEGELITLTVCDDDREEGYKIVQKIEEETRRRKLDLKDFAVLYRTNAQSRSIEDALRRNSIPYIIVGGVAFYKRKEIKDVLAYLRVIANQKDAESILRIINYPARGIGEKTVEAVQAFAKAERLQLFDALTSEKLSSVLNERMANAVRGFGALLQKYIALKESVNVSELARALVDDLGILRQFKDENTIESLARRENVLELLSALTEFNDLHPDAGLDGFLEEVSLVSDVDQAEFGRNAVTIMTLHAAKGLEFPVVFIAGLEEGLFPLSNSLLERKELEEERRLFYVGITRAMNKLYLMYALSRYRFGEFSYSVKSRFLDEIDEPLLVTEGSSRFSALARSQAAPNSYAAPKPRVRQQKSVDDTAKYFADTMPDYENESQLGKRQNHRVGSRVVHDAFGKGKIVAIDGRGDNARATVEFDSVGRKNLMLKFANLKSA
ncbi:MAG: UvrD-helicase domain-containing protein [Ignavibacteriae bacterium]|nr:UvrD-helicase domain-containing protein [Ignavibacteriota bacterium]